MTSDLCLAFIESVKVPFAEIGGVITLIIERIGDRWHFRRQWVLVTSDSVVWVASADQRTAKGAAKRRTGHSLFENDTFLSEAIDVGRAHIGITAKAEGLTAMLITKDPDEVRLDGAAHVEYFVEQSDSASTMG
tara:strand:- start:148 stop:549 length:402 start_codon:yes stop_codon:yes gene_type:complete